MALDLISWDKTLITLFGIRSQISLNTYKLYLVRVISIDGLTAIITRFFLISFWKQFQFGDALLLSLCITYKMLSPFYNEDPEAQWAEVIFSGS